MHFLLNERISFLGKSEFSMAFVSVGTQTSRLFRPFTIYNMHANIFQSSLLFRNKVLLVRRASLFSPVSLQFSVISTFQTILKLQIGLVVSLFISACNFTSMIH